MSFRSDGSEIVVVAPTVNGLASGSCGQPSDRLRCGLTTRRRRTTPSVRSVQQHQELPEEHETRPPSTIHHTCQSAIHIHNSLVRTNRSTGSRVGGGVLSIGQRPANGWDTVLPFSDGTAASAGFDPNHRLPADASTVPEPMLSSETTHTVRWTKPVPTKPATAARRSVEKWGEQKRDNTVSEKWSMERRELFGALGCAASSCGAALLGGCLSRYQDPVGIGGIAINNRREAAVTASLTITKDGTTMLEEEYHLKPKENDVTDGVSVQEPWMGEPAEYEITVAADGLEGETETETFNSREFTREGDYPDDCTALTFNALVK